MCEGGSGGGRWVKEEGARGCGGGGGRAAKLFAHAEVFYTHRHNPLTYSHRHNPRDYAHRHNLEDYSHRHNPRDYAHRHNPMDYAHKHISYKFLHNPSLLSPNEAVIKIGLWARAPWAHSFGPGPEPIGPGQIWAHSFGPGPIGPIHLGPGPGPIWAHLILI